MNKEAIKMSSDDNPRISPLSSPRVSEESFKRKKSIVVKGLTYMEKFKSRTPRVLQLFILYFALGVLSGIGGLFFYYCEYDGQADELKTKKAMWENIEANFDAQGVADAKDWADNYANIFHESNKWTLRYAAFFAATTFTTCGFGLQAPVTWGGRLMVFVYGLPAIMIYGMLAKKIGMLMMYYIEKLCRACGVTAETWARRRLLFIGSFFFVGFLLMAGLIDYTATDEGFGHGITDYGVAFYFLYTTTMTIGYGDVMMSGSNPILTAFIGMWLASTCGLAICFAQELSQAATKPTTFHTGSIPNHGPSSNRSSEQSSKDILKIIQVNKNKLEDLTEIQETNL